MAWMAGVGSLLGGLGSIAGASGIFGGGNPGPGASEAFSQMQMNEQEAFQREMAQNSIQWRVQDAQKAGISPLAALGASTMGGTVSAPAPDPGQGSNVSNNIGSALQKAGVSLDDVIRNLSGADKKDAAVKQIQTDQQLKSNDLDIAIKGAQLAKIQGQVGTPNAPMPGHESTGPAGQGNGFVVVPSKVTASQPGAQNITAGPGQTETSYVANADGTQLIPQPTRPEVTNSASVFNPEYDAWFYRNRINPTSSPPPELLPSGYVRWDFGGGSWHAIPLSKEASADRWNSR